MDIGRIKMNKKLTKELDDKLFEIEQDIMDLEEDIMCGPQLKKEFLSKELRKIADKLKNIQNG